MRISKTGFAAVAMMGTLAVLASATASYAAGSKTTTIVTNATVATNCIISTNSPNTITYDPIVTNLSMDAQDNSGSLALNCTRNASISIDLDHGQHAIVSGSYFQPELYGAATPHDTLKYTINHGSYTGLWGTTTSVDGTTKGTVLTDTGKGPGNGNKLTETLYIDIPMNQNVQADSYADSVIATVTY